MSQSPPLATDASKEQPRAVRPWLPTLGTILFILLVLTVYWRPFGDLDFAWQIRTGGDIVQSGQLRVQDTFTYTIAGKHLPDFEWAYEVFLWLVWQGFGYGGLHLLKTVCVLTPLGLVARRLRREGVGWHVVLGLLAIAVVVLLPLWNLRPFYVTTIGLLLLSGWLQDHCAGRRRLSWEVPLLMLLWGNTHPGVIAGQGLLAGAIGWEWINRWLRLNRPLDTAACWRLTLFGGLGLLASVCCPGPLARLQYTFNPDLVHPIMRGFTELMPSHSYALSPPYLGSLAYLFAALVLWSIVYRFREYRLWEIALLLGVTVLATHALREMQDWLLVMMAVGTPHLTALYRESQANADPARPSRLARLAESARGLVQSPLMRFQRGLAATFVVALVVFSLTPGLVNLVPRKHGKDWPIGAVDHIERHALNGRFFGNPNYGAYLVWRLGPERARCYVDTRGFYFPPEILEDSLHVLRLGDDWQRRMRNVLDQGTDYFLLDVRGPDGALWREIDPRIQPLYLDELSALVSADEVRRALADRLSLASQSR